MKAACRLVAGADSSFKTGGGLIPDCPDGKASSAFSSSPTLEQSDSEPDGDCDRDDSDDRVVDGCEYSVTSTVALEISSGLAGASPGHEPSSGSSASIEGDVSNVKTVGGLETTGLHACCTSTADSECPPSPMKHFDVSMLSVGTPKAFAIEERMKVRSADVESNIVSKGRNERVLKKGHARS